MSNKKELKKWNSPLLVIAIAIFALLVIASGLWLWNAIKDNNASQSARSQLSALTLPGEEVHYAVSKSCSDNQTISISIFGPNAVTCGYTGYKIYRNAGNVADGIKKAEDTLKAAGFEPSRSATIKETGEIPFHTTKDKNASAVLLYASSQSKDGSAHLGGSASIPFNGGYLYGVGIFVRL
ncbi:MAG TPA: hypothetical protein VJM32_05475 [Candidatus Saccharimonadales bacterium]|nr:hypothetical protein [Candidatus Saccharimonadales bacterium]